MPTPLSKPSKKHDQQDWEQKLLWQIQALKLPEPIREYRFAAEFVGSGKGLRERLAAAGLKDWRADFAWLKHDLLVEVEGITPLRKTKTGKVSAGRHQTISGMTEDCRKYAAAQRLGWTVYRCTQPMIKSGEAVRDIDILLEDKAP